MPPHSKFLWEEGAMFKSFKIVDRGVFQEEALVQAFMDPAQHPGCSGSRGLQDNLSDLKAQIAANQVLNILLVDDIITRLDRFVSGTMLNEASSYFNQHSMKS